MKVILVGPAHPFRGGIANFNESLCSALIKAGHNCEIITFYFQYPRFLFPGKTQHSEDKAPQGLKIKMLISSINPFSWFRTARYINKQEADLVIFQYWLPFMAPAHGSIARQIDKKDTALLAIVHNAIPHEKKLTDTVLSKFFIKPIQGFVCLSKQVMNDLNHLTLNRNKHLTHHPVYEIFGHEISKTEARQALGLSENDKYILFFGLIRKYKGLELLIRSMSLEILKKHNIKILVAGEFYENKKTYNDLISDLGLADQVVLFDQFIPNEEVKHFFCACDLIVQPYISATQSGVTQVAYHFGRPMLVTNVGGLPEIVHHEKTGYVCEVNEYAIANAIDDFYTNNREKEMEENVKLEKHRFSWENFVDVVITAYRQV